MGRFGSVMWACVVVCLLLAACGGSGNSSQANSKASFGQLLSQGMTNLTKGNERAAIRSFRQAIAKNPKSPVGYYDLGVAYGRQGDRHDSLVQYAKALHQDKNYVPALYNYAVAFQQKNPPVATYFFRRVIKLQPDSPSALLNLGLLLYAQHPHSNEGALRAMKAAVVLQPSLYSAIPPSLRAEVRRIKPLKHPNKRKAAR